jgi:hypothetical protein
VSGHERALLESAVLPLRDHRDITIREKPPNLEDVFIYLQESGKRAQ